METMNTHDREKIAEALRDIIKVADTPKGMVELLPEAALAFIAREAKNALLRICPDSEQS